MNTLDTKEIDSSAERIEKLRSLVCSSKTGASVLAEVDDNNTKIYFEKTKDSVGFYDPSKNRIVLNPVHSDDLLASVLVHEGRHSWQDRQYVNMTTALKPKCLLMVGYAMEADACAVQTRFAHEMRETNPEIMAQLKLGRYEKIANAYEKTVEQGGEKLATEAAFKAWYATTAPEIYGDNYAQYMILSAQNNASFHFRREAPALNIASAFCQMNRTTRYLNDYAFLEAPENLYLKKETKDKLEKAIQVWSSKQFNPAQVYKELDQIAVKTKDGKIIGGMPKTQNINPVLQQARLNGGR